MSLIVNIANKSVTELIERVSLLESTAVLDGMVISATPGGSTFDLTSGTVRFIDSTTNPLSAIATTISYAGGSGISISNIATQPLTYIGINASGTILQQAAEFSPKQRRTIATVAVIIHNTGVVSSIQEGRVPTPDQLANQISDLNYAIGPVNASGNVYGPNGANLKLDKTAGEIHAGSINRSTDPENPSFLTVAALTAAPIVYTWRDGSGGFNNAVYTDITPGLYDDGTGGVGAPNGTVQNNFWTIHRVYMSPTGITVVHFGQNKFSSKERAMSAINTAEFIVNPEITGALIRCFLVVQGNATDLSDIDYAQFYKAGDIGGLIAGASSSTVQTMQGVYGVSPTPQIITDSSLGDVQIQGGTGDDAEAVFTIKNNAGSASASWTGAGDMSLSAANHSLGSGMGANTLTIADPTTTVEILGDLTVSGTTTTINTTTLVVEDKNVELGAVITPTDSTANGGGLTLKGTTDKTINWSSTDSKWHYNQGVIIDAGDLNVTANVGIGTPTASAKLHVKSTTGTNLRIENQTSAAYWSLTARDNGSFDLGKDGLDTNFKITSSGYVGVGTSMPDSLIHASGSGLFGNGLKLQNTGGSGGQWVIGANDTPGELRIYDHSAFATRMSISQAGNVAIGKSGPSANYLLTMHVPAATNCNIGFQENNVDKWLIGSVTSSDAFRFRDMTAAIDRVTIANNGNVGIGVTDPGTARLNVYSDGSTSATYSLYAQNSTGPKLVVRDDGNTGINTSDPYSALDIKTGTNRRAGFFDNAGGTTLVGLDDSGASSQFRVAGNPLVLTGNGGSGVGHIIITSDGSVFTPNLKSGTSQVAAGALVNEWWVDTVTNSIKIGV